MMQEEIQVHREANTGLRGENARIRALVAELLPLKTQVEHLSTQVKQLESHLAKRGRCNQSMVGNLLARLSKRQDAVLRFLEDFSVPF